MDQLLNQLHDIQGLDQISSWPLAIGWWVVIFIGALLAAIMGIYLFRRLAYLRSWKNETKKTLNRLEKNLSESNAKETLVVLSEYLRRIAVHRFSRQECAGLTGNAWLDWLAEKDPKKFDWKMKGTPLIDAPYAPPNRTLPPGEIKVLIQAVKSWVF